MKDEILTRVTVDIACNLGISRAQLLRFDKAESSNCKETRNDDTQPFRGSISQQDVNADW